MALGRASPVVAERLFVSESAVGKHIASIFAELGLVGTATVDRRVSAVLAFLNAR